MRADSKLSRHSTSSKQSNRLDVKSPTKSNKATSEDNLKNLDKNSLFESSSENDDSSLFEKEKGLKHYFYTSINYFILNVYFYQVLTARVQTKSLVMILHQNDQVCLQLQDR